MAIWIPSHRNKAYQDPFEVCIEQRQHSKGIFTLVSFESLEWEYKI
jgi:hypothetical protein